MPDYGKPTVKVVGLRIWDMEMVAVGFPSLCQQRARKSFGVSEYSFFQVLTP